MAPENQDLTTTGDGVEGEAAQEELNLAESTELDNEQGDEQLQDDELQDDSTEELSPIEAIAEEIAERRREELEEQQSFEEDEDDDPNDNDEPVAGEEEDDTTTITVNGQAVKVSTKDVLEQGVRTLQKESAADARFKEATTKTTELDAREQELIERENKFKQNLATDEQIDADAERFSEALVSDEGAAGEMFKEVLKDNRDLKATTAELISDGKETRQERVRRQQEAQDDMVKHYHGNFSDIAADANLTTIFNSEVAKARQVDPNIGYQDAFETAGSVVRERYMPKQDKPSTPKDRKRKMPKQAKRAGGKLNLQKPAPKQETRAEIIEGMRESRGL